MISFNEYKISWVGQKEDGLAIFAISEFSAWRNFISWDRDWVDDEGDVYVVIHRMVGSEEVEGWECGNHKETGEFFINSLVGKE